MSTNHGTPYVHQSWPSLSLEDVVEALNSRNTSGLHITSKDFLRGLGEKVYNSSGAVVGAREATITWVGR